MANLTPEVAYDLLAQPGLLDRLPALKDAFDPVIMRDRFQQALFSPGQSRYSIENCQPGKAIFLPGDICSMQFEVDLYGLDASQLDSVLINARLFPGLEAAQEYRQMFLDPLLPAASKHPELTQFLSPIGVIKDMAMVYAVYPIDGEIPTLLDATHPERMLRIFKETLSESLSGEMSIDGFNLEHAHYGRHHRCVLRYRLYGHDAHGAPSDLVVFGKVDAGGLGENTVRVIAAMHEHMQDARSPFPFRIPRTLAYLPELNLLILEAIQGGPLIAKQLKARISGKDLGAVEDLRLEESIAISARIAAAFHSSGIKLGKRRTFEDEANTLKGMVQRVQEINPGFGHPLANSLDQAILAAGDIVEFPLCFSHGDFTYTQLIFSGKDAGLVDFDTVCQAEPALDLGQFLAYQRLNVRKEKPSEASFPAHATDVLCDLFMSSYVQAATSWIGDERQLQARVNVYEIFSLIRMAAHAWQKLKGPRFQAAISLLEERVACLQQVT